MTDWKERYGQRAIDAKVDVYSLRLSELFAELRVLWDWLPLDRVEEAAVMLRRALAAAPFGAAAQRLGETGNIVVSQRALEAYEQQVGHGEQARREFTELLLDAKRGVDTKKGYERWRVRRKGIDVSVTVDRVGRLAIVTAVGSVRAGRG